MLREISQTETNSICYHLYVESKKWNKWMNITKQKQTYRYRKQTSVYQWSEGRGEVQDGAKRLRDTNY